MKSRPFCVLMATTLMLLANPGCQVPVPETVESTETVMVKYDVFSFQLNVDLPGSTVEIYDSITGDISDWWDHSFSESPYQLYIEAKPGGGFWEYFDEDGNGVLHATVIYADRGNVLRFDGPLGLSGKAIQMVTTYTFEAIDEDTTRLIVDVHASGELDPGLDEIVEKVWRHFIFEQFQPYVEARFGNVQDES